MEHSSGASVARLLTLIPLTVVLAVGCGGETTDISEAVDDFNRQFEQVGLSLDCPDEVDGGEGTTFDCTLEGTEGSETVAFEITRENDEPVIDYADEQELDEALERVTGN